MMYKAIVSFSGAGISMMAGQVAEISKPALVDDLLGAGYIIPFEADEVPEPKTENPPKAVKKSSTKGKGSKK